MGEAESDSYAFSIAPAAHWNLADCVAIVNAAHKKTGSTSTLREFRRLVGKIVDADRLPDYAIALADDVVSFANRNWRDPAAQPAPAFAGPPLKPETHDKARQVAPGWDLCELERQWRAWIAEKGADPKRPDAAFVGFCRRKGPRP